MTETLQQVGPYQVVRQIGSGGMAVIFLARQPALDREVALKRLDIRLDPDVLARFVRESRLGGALSHPNVVHVYDFFEHDGVPYIAMEYLARGSLRPYVGQLGLAQSAGVLEGVLAGLAHAQSKAVVHRDMKPENVLLTSTGGVKIADFGIAKAANQAATGFHTATGTTMGTPAYMAPEQVMGKEVGYWTDLYSTGVIAYELLVGRLPFDSTDSPIAVLMQHVNDPIPPPCEANPRLDPRLASWIERMMAKEPDGRPAGARAAWEQLEDVVIDLLGARWRRAARILEEGSGEQPKPLTPAPFASMGAAPPAPARASSPPEASTPSPPEATTRPPVPQSAQPPQPPQPQPAAAAPPAAPSSAGAPRGGRSRGRLAVGALAVLVAVGAAAVLLSGGSSGPATSSAELTRAGESLLTANRALSGALVKLVPEASPSTAQYRARVAQAALKGLRALAAKPGSLGLSEVDAAQVRSAITGADAYLRAVTRALGGPSAGLAVRVVTSGQALRDQLSTLVSVRADASSTVFGTTQLATWARAAVAPADSNDAAASSPNDHTKPTITVANPRQGGSYGKGELADYSCADEPGGSGLSGCVVDTQRDLSPRGSPVVTGGPLCPGAGKFTLSSYVADNNGNSANRSINYTCE